MKKLFLLGTSVVVLSFGCSVCKHTPCISEEGLSMKDKALLSFLRTTNLKNIEIQSTDLMGAMNLLNMHIVRELGYPSGVSYVIQPHETNSVISDPFDSSKAEAHGVGNSVSIQITSASVEEVLTRIASQTGYKVKLSNGIIFY
jgi:hypothetical protein